MTAAGGVWFQASWENSDPLCVRSTSLRSQGLVLSILLCPFGMGSQNTVGTRIV